MKVLSIKPLKQNSEAIFHGMIIAFFSLACMIFLVIRTIAREFSIRHIENSQVKYENLIEEKYKLDAEKKQWKNEKDTFKTREKSLDTRERALNSQKGVVATKETNLEQSRKKLETAKKYLLDMHQLLISIKGKAKKEGVIKDCINKIPQIQENLRVLGITNLDNSCHDLKKNLEDKVKNGKNINQSDLEKSSHLLYEIIKLT